jgi:hypothetical protein
MRLWTVVGRLGAVLAVLLALSAPVAAETGLPDVDVTMVVAVHDTAAWLALHEEVLGTAQEAPKVLGVSVASATGGRRAIAIHRPSFGAQIFFAGGAQSLRVVVAGKIPGGDALTTLTHFQRAVLQIQSGAMDNEVTLAFGLSAVTADLLELYLTRP